MGDATGAAIARAVKHNSSLQNLEIDTYYAYSASCPKTSASSYISLNRTCATCEVTGVPTNSVTSVVAGSGYSTAW